MISIVVMRMHNYFSEGFISLTFDLLLLNQARAGLRRAPGFLKLFLCGGLYVCVCVCVSAPEAINN